MNKPKFPFELGKCYKNFKICFFPDGDRRLKQHEAKVELEVEGLCGYNSFAGDDLAECISKALMFYYEQGKSINEQA